MLYDIKLIKQEINQQSGKVSYTPTATRVNIPSAITVSDTDQTYENVKQYLEEEYNVTIKEIIDIRPV